MTEPRTPAAAHVPPHDLDAEKSVIGSVLLAGGDVFLLVSGELTPSAFYLSRHALIWSVIEELASAGEPLDLVTVSGALRSRGKLDEAGGELYLGELAEATPFPAHAPKYARIVSEKASRRAWIDTCRRSIEAAHESGEGQDRMFARTISQLQALQETGSVRVERAPEIAEGLLSELEQFAEGERAGVQTTYREFDRAAGHWNPGDLIVLAGRPKLGKTTVACDIARRNAERHGVRVGFYGGEMTRRQLLARMISAHAHERLDLDLPYSHMLNNRRFVRENMQGIQEATRSLLRAVADRIRILDGRIAMDQIGASFAKLKREHPGDPWLFVIDYLQRLQWPRGARDSFQAISANVAAAKDLAQRLDAPVLLLSQFNRESPRGGGVDVEPEVHHLKGSGDIEQELDRLIILHRPPLPRNDAGEPVAEDVAERKLILKLNRHGPCTRQVLEWLAAYGRLEDYGDGPRPAANTAPEHTDVSLNGYMPEHDEAPF